MTVSVNKTFSKENPQFLSEELYPYRWISLIIVCTAAFLTILDFFIVNVAISEIQNNLHATFAQIQLVIAGYGLTYSVGLITGGRLGDVFGRKKMFIYGVIGFTIASAFCGLSHDINMLIFSRIFQGIMSALMMPQVLSILQVSFPPHEKNLAFSIYGMTLGFACIAGQVFGGLLISLNLFGLSWRPIFLVNLPIGLIGIIASFYYVKESFSSTARKLDLVGVFIVTTGLSLLIYPLILGRENGWSSGMLSLLFLSIPVLTAFVFFERYKSKKDGSPLVEMELFKNRSFLVGLIIILGFQNTLAAFFFLYTVELQIGLGFSSLKSGLIFSAFGIGFLLASTFSAKVIHYLGKYIIHTGLAAMIIGLLWFIQLSLTIGADIDYPDMIIPLFIYGVGQGLVLTPLMNIILSGIESNNAGTASGVLITSQQFALALGLAIIGIIFFGNISNNSERIKGIYEHNLKSKLLNENFTEHEINVLSQKFSMCIEQKSNAKDPNFQPNICQDLISLKGFSNHKSISKSISSILRKAKTQNYYESFSKSLFYNIIILLFSFILAFLLPDTKKNKKDTSNN